MLQLVIWLSVLVITSCVSGSDTFSLQNGDIVFRGHTEDSLSRAINEVTGTGSATGFSHMGVILVEGEEIFVVHASSEKGVVRESLEDFRYGKGTHPRPVVAYRIEEQYGVDMDSVLHKAASLIGEPYNFTYILDDTGYYCSEFVYTIFKKYEVFELEPMTFKSPDTQEFPKAWVQHYKDLGISIPEGLPGCNPNGMAQSGKLRLLGAVRDPNGGG